MTTGDDTEHKEGVKPDILYRPQALEDLAVAVYPCRFSHISALYVYFSRACLSSVVAPLPQISVYD